MNLGGTSASSWWQLEGMGTLRMRPRMVFFQTWIRVQLFVTPCTAACQASLSFTSPAVWPSDFFCSGCYKKKYQNGWLKQLYISVKIYFLTVLKKSKIKFLVDSFSDANFLVGFLMSAHLLYPYMVFAPCVCLEEEEELWSLFLFL